jgi:hypothetical protein
MLFVVDMSGSNVNDSANPGGSDPHKTVRGGSIQEFFNLYKAKNNFSWSFNTFAESNSRALIGASATQPAFSDASAMQGAINQFMGITDMGNTPYVAALDLAYKAINTDNNSNSRPTSSYSICRWGSAIRGHAYFYRPYCGSHLDLPRRDRYCRGLCIW